MKKNIIRWLTVLSVLIISFGATAAGIFFYDRQTFDTIFAPQMIIVKKIVGAPEDPIKPDIPVPSHTPDPDLAVLVQPENALPVEKLPPVDMDRMKREGCVADGLLSGYGRTSKEVGVINDSNCYYLHRAIETWLDEPNFKEITEIKRAITKKDVVYGMFIAEAIDTKEGDFIYRVENRPFDFDAMCRKNSDDFWGDHSCKPDVKRGEYRAYVMQITRDAMDLGIQVFLFGQVYHQDDLDEPRVGIVLADMRSYAKRVGLDIVIGAQTNDITDEKYLRQFDFIEGGVGLSPRGTVEKNACFSRWYKKPGDWCWALLWHDRFVSKAPHVLVHLDWSAQFGDDMNIFTMMSTDLRHRTLKKLHHFFTQQDVGFLLPVLAPLPKNHTGCHGPKKRYYSPSNKFGCPDEDVINDIIGNVPEKR